MSKKETDNSLVEKKSAQVPKERLDQMISLFQRKKFTKVIREAQILLSDYPKSPTLWNLVATAAAQEKNFDEATYAFQKVIFFQPDNVKAHYNLGVILKIQGKLDDALQAYKSVIKIQPNHPLAHNNVGNIFKTRGMPAKALNSYRKAIALKPDYAEAYNNMGSTLNDLGKPDEAIKALNQAIKLKPNYAGAYLNKSMALLKNQEFEKGFKLHEWRWSTDSHDSKFLQSSKPLWNGQKNKVVFLWAEQGVGDEIMYSSLIPELHEICTKLIVQCDKRLIPLFKRSFHKDINYYDKSDVVIDTLYDFHTSTGSLPRVFRKSLKSFEKTNNGYLFHDKNRSQQLRKALINDRKNILIGISWKTFSKLDDAPNRNIKLYEIARALESANTRLVCLQYGNVAEEISELKNKFNIDITTVPNIDNHNDIDGLASLIMACDTIVSTTNVTVHLAGALGKDVHVLLPFSSRWIWGLNRSPPSWYKNAFPYRQPKDGNWKFTIKSLVTNLKKQNQQEIKK